MKTQILCWMWCSMVKDTCGHPRNFCNNLFKRYCSSLTYGLFNYFISVCRAGWLFSNSVQTQFRRYWTWGKFIFCPRPFPFPLHTSCRARHVPFDSALSSTPVPEKHSAEPWRSAVRLEGKWGCVWESWLKSFRDIPEKIKGLWTFLVNIQPSS